MADMQAPLEVIVKLGTVLITGVSCYFLLKNAVNLLAEKVKMIDSIIAELKTCSDYFKKTIQDILITQATHAVEMRNLSADLKDLQILMEKHVEREHNTNK